MYDGVVEGEIPSTKLYTGIFHGFGQDVVNYDGQWLAIQVCIVEQTNGCLDVVAIQYCKFEGIH